MSRVQLGVAAVARSPEVTLQQSPGLDDGGALAGTWLPGNAIYIAATHAA